METILREGGWRASGVSPLAWPAGLGRVHREPVRPLDLREAHWLRRCRQRDVTLGGCAMARMRVVQVAAPGAPLELVEREVPEPGRTARSASGSRPAASATATRSRRRAAFRASATRACRATRSPAASTRSAPGAEPWRAGQRVGVGWYGGHCGHCDRCRRGDFITCREARIPGITYDGGYADYMIAPAQALARDPGRARRRGRGTPALRRHHHVQRPAQQRRPRRRPGRRPGHRRPRPSGAAVRGQDGLRHGRDRPRQGQGGAGPHAGRTALSRQPGGGRRRRACRAAAAPASSWRRSPAPRRCRP